MPGEPVLRSVVPIASVSRFKYGLNLNVSLNCMEIAQFNANSLLGHIDLIRAHLDSHFYHIISISETWLHSGISDNVVRLGDFTLIRNDREGRRGEGVACYVHRSFKVKLLASSPSVFSNSPEFLILELSCPGSQSLLFISMYRRPKAILFNDFFNVFSRFSFAYRNIIFGGDLNCNLSGSGVEAASLRESVSSFALSIVDSDPTYHLAVTDSWLDVFITDSSDKVQSFRKSEAPFIAGHDLREMSYRFESPPNPVRTIVRRSFGRFNESAFLDSLAVCSMKNILTHWKGCLPLLKSNPSWNRFAALSYSHWIIRLPCVHFLFADRGPRGFPQFLGPELESEIIYLGELSAPAVFLPWQSIGTTGMCL